MPQIIEGEVTEKSVEVVPEGVAEPLTPQQAALAEVQETYATKYGAGVADFLVIHMALIDAFGRVLNIARSDAPAPLKALQTFLAQQDVSHILSDLAVSAAVLKNNLPNPPRDEDIEVVKDFISVTKEHHDAFAAVSRRFDGGTGQPVDAANDSVTDDADGEGDGTAGVEASRIILPD